MDLNIATDQDIKVFCEQDLPESVRLDYKRGLSSNDPRKQIIRGVSAFANTQGGILVYGVGTKAGSKSPDWPSDGMPSDPDFEKRVTRWCIEHINPPVVPFVKWIDNTKVPGKGFGVIRTELSQHSPHTVEGGTRIFVRRADNSDPVPATFHEMELLRSMRQRALQLDKLHSDDLRERVGPEANYRDPWLRVLVVPIFPREDAIPLGALPDIARKLRDIGFTSIIVSALRSYSYGVLAHAAGWRFALTGRGALGLGLVNLEARKEGIDLESLLDWALLAARAGNVLAKEAGHWGGFRIHFEAHGYRGLSVKYSRSQIYTYEPCVDDAISIEASWQAVELQEDWKLPAAQLFWHMMWAFGQQDRMWTENQIVERLDKKSKGL